MLDALSVGWSNELSESGSAVSNDFVPQEGVPETPVDPTVPLNGELPVNPGQSPYQQPYFAARTPAPAPPKRPRRALPLGLLASGLVLALLVVAGGIWLFNAGERNAPAKQVASFLTALVEGRAEDAMRLSGNVLQDQDKTLINDAVYQNASNKISGFSIGQTRIANGKATVSAEISQGGESYAEEFALSLDGQELFIDKWRLDPIVLPTMTVQLAGPASLGLTVAGVGLKPDLVPATATQPESLKKLNVKALPADYPVAAANSDPDLTTNQATAKVRGFNSAKPQNAVVAATLNEAGKASITAAVNQYLDACAAQRTAVLKDCPFSGKADDPLLSQYQVSNARWSIVTRPTLSIAEWSPSIGWLVLSTAPGTASFAADLSNSVSSGTASIDAMTFSLGGQVLGFKDGVAQFSRPTPGTQS